MAFSCPQLAKKAPMETVNVPFCLSKSINKPPMKCVLIHMIGPRFSPTSIMVGDIVVTLDYIKHPELNLNYNDFCGTLTLITYCLMFIHTQNNTTIQHPHRKFFLVQRKWLQTGHKREIKSDNV